MPVPVVSAAALCASLARGVQRLRLGLSALAAVLVFPVAPAASESALEATWRQARVGLPAGVVGPMAVFGRVEDSRVRDALEQAGRRTADRQNAEDRVPLALVLHGCSGIRNEEDNLRYLLTLGGLAVVMPDSFAREGRVPLCDVGDKVAAVDERTYRQRRQELVYALRRVRAFSWVDPERLYLIGFSEGGAAAAQYDGDAFARLVIVAWHCNGEGELFGLRAPEEVPVLAIIMRDDPWYGAYRGRHCGEQFGGRAHSKSLQLAGRGHAVLTGAVLETSRTAKNELLRFLTDRAD